MNNINSEKISAISYQSHSDNSPHIDYIFFDRRKRSFRYLIFSVVILTFCLWFSDRYLRFNLDETKYRVALTLEKESARPIMRNIATKIISNPNLLDDPRYLQYLEYLALIEEDDAVIKLYQDIYNIGNIDSSFLSNYAIKLYFLGEYNKARELLREAQNLPPNNSLLGYLESAMIINPSVVNEATFAEGISIIAKENRSGLPVTFPEPFWHDTLPKYTYSYYVQKSNILNHYLAPLYKLSSEILNKIERDLNGSNFQNVQVWLEELFLMGKKVGMGINLSELYSNLPICIFSLKIQKDALTLSDKFSQILHSNLLEKEKNKLSQISNFLEVCEKLENIRRFELEKNRANRTKIIGFIFLGLIELLMIYWVVKLVSYLLSKLQSNLLVFYFPNFIYFLCLVWIILLFILSFYHLYLNKILFENISLNIFIWSFLIISPFLTSLLILRHKKSNINGSANLKNNPEILKLVSPKRFYSVRLFIYFTEKLSGILLGHYVILVCILFLSFRIISSSYPFQLNLIRDPMRIDEFNLIKDFILFIHS